MSDLKRRISDSTGWNRAMSEIEESFKMCPKFAVHELTEHQIEDITDRAARKAVALAKSDMYQGVGKVVIGWIFWIVGVGAVGLFALFVKLGWIKPWG